MVSKQGRQPNDSHKLLINNLFALGAHSSLKNAFLEDQDISHDPSGPIGLQTIDQKEELLLNEATMLQLDPPIDEEDYLFTLRTSEGITDMFDIASFNV